MADFNNYFNNNKSFDSFNGTELKCYMKVPTKYDAFGQMSKFELIEMGNVSAISGAEQYAADPIPVIGKGRPIAITTGSSIVAGSIAFETFNQGFVNEVKDILKKAGIKKVSMAFDTDSTTPKYGYNDIGEINDFPLIDIVILGVKENDPNKKIEKEIMGVRFNRGGSGVGVNQLGIREQYSYVAQKMTDFTPVVGASEEGIGDTENSEYEYDIFG